jgi:hypothetical protein
MSERSSVAEAEKTVAGDPPRHRGGLARSFAGMLVGALVVLGLGAVLVFGAAASGLVALPAALATLFTSEQVDRSEPPVLLSIQDLSRFVAAEGSYQVVVDLEDDTRYVPDWLKGERTIFLAEGSVEVYVDFSDLTEDAVHVAEDSSAVTVTLPAPAFTEPRIDLEGSRALSESRGLIDRAADFFGDDVGSQREVLLRAEDLLAEAAQESGLTSRAEENTRKTLEGLLGGLGYETVTVLFEDAQGS